MTPDFEENIRFIVTGKLRPVDVLHEPREEFVDGLEQDLLSKLRELRQSKALQNHKD